MTAACATVKESIAPKEYIVPRKSTFPGSSTRIDTKPAKTTSASQGVLKRGWSFRKAPGSCWYDAIEYVIREAPMMPAFVAMKRIVAASTPTYTWSTSSSTPVDTEVVDDAEYGVVLVAAVLRRQREQRRQFASNLLHWQRGEGDERQGEVDREDGHGHESDRAWDRAHGVASLLGEVGDRLDARVGDHRHRDREQEVVPRGCNPPVDVRLQCRRAEDEHEAEQHEQKLRREVDDGKNDVEVG